MSGAILFLNGEGLLKIHPILPIVGIFLFLSHLETSGSEDPGSATWPQVTDGVQVMGPRLQRSTHCVHVHF